MSEENDVRCGEREGHWGRSLHQGREASSVRPRLEDFPGLYWICDSRGACCYAGPQLVAFTGLTEEALLGFGWQALVPPEDVVALHGVWSEASACGDVFLIDIRLMGSDGKERWLALQGKPAPSDAGEGDSWALAAFEVEHRKRAEKMLGDTAVALQNANQELSASQERYHLVNLATHDVIWDWDLMSGSLSWNEAIELTFGFKPADVPGDISWWESHIHPEDRERVTTDLRTVVENPAATFWSTEYRFRHRLGHWLDVLDRGYVARDGRGRALRMIGCMLDLTERKRVVENLRYSEEQFRYLAEAIPQLVWITRPDGYHEYFNKHWYDYTGTRPGETHGELWARLLHPDDFERTLRRWTHSLETGEPYEIEYRFRRASDGHYRWFLGRALPIRDGAGKIVRWFGTCTDIQAQKEVEAALDEGRKRLEVILANLPVGVFIADGEGTIVDTNEQAKAIWAGEPTVQQKREYAEYRGYWPDTGRRIAGEEWALARALTRGETIVGETVDIERFDGTRGTILANAAPFRDAEGRITGGVVVIHDITERRRAEEALRESEARARCQYADLEEIYRLAPVGLFTFDGEYRFQRINEAMAEINGLPVEAHHGKSMDEIVPDLAAFLREIYRPIFERGEPVLEVEIHGATRKAPGMPRDWLGNFYPLKNPQGEVVGLIGAVLEVTERKKAERALRESEERLREMDRRKDDFLAMLSHELRNPLAPIRNCVYILERVEPGGEKARWARQVIERQAQHMARLIDDLLDVTRISRGKINLRRGRVDLNLLVRNAAEDMREVFEEAGLELVVREADRALYVEGDATRLSQVIGNLLQNAAKFTPLGGRATLEAEASADGQAIVRISDTGVGLSPDVAERLFEPFVQADRTLDRSRGGLGLGLSLAKGLVELHGGKVEARSQGEGQGSEFLFSLPLMSGAIQDRPRAASDTPERVTRKWRVLVIEDNVDTAETLKEALEMNEHEVSVANSGPQGIERAQELRPQVILCDIGLPGLDGYEVARKIRADADLRSTFLVALSGYAQVEDVAKAREAGFDRHVAKPPDLEFLVRLLADLPYGEPHS